MAYTPQYYDVLLVAVAVAMGLGGAVGALTTTPTATAIVGAGLVAALLVGHGLFVSGPVDAPTDLTDEVDPDELGASVGNYPTAE